MAKLQLVVETGATTWCLSPDSLAEQLAKVRDLEVENGSLRDENEALRKTPSAEELASILADALDDWVDVEHGYLEELPYEKGLAYLTNAVLRRLGRDA